MFYTVKFRRGDEYVIEPVDDDDLDLKINSVIKVVLCREQNPPDEPPHNQD